MYCVECKTEVAGHPGAPCFYCGNPLIDNFTPAPWQYIVNVCRGAYGPYLVDPRGRYRALLCNSHGYIGYIELSTLAALIKDRAYAPQVEPAPDAGPLAPLGPGFYFSV